MLSVIIPTKDRPAILAKTVASVTRAVEKMDAEIIIINDSTTGEITFPEHPAIKIVKSGKGSAAVSRNLGAKKALGDVLLFLDDDILIDHVCLKALYEKTTHQPDAVFLPNWTYPPHLNDRLTASGFGRFILRHNYNSLRGYNRRLNTWDDNNAFSHNGVASYCLMMKKDLFNDIGGYSENFTFAGFEDHDISSKLKNKNIRIFIEPRFMVFHNEEDKLEIGSWLGRLENSAVTRKQAVNIGYSELNLHYSFVRKAVFSTIYGCRNLLRSLLTALPNTKIADPVYVFIFKMLVGAHIYKGYTKNK